MPIFRSFLNEFNQSPKNPKTAKSWHQKLPSSERKVRRDGSSGFVLAVASNVENIVLLRSFLLVCQLVKRHHEVVFDSLDAKQGAPEELGWFSCDDSVQ